MSEVFEHCWHFPANAGGQSMTNGSAYVMRCCHCGVRATRHEECDTSIPAGHGAYYPIGVETRIRVEVHGPEFCARQSESA